jgi:hypothetical protein
MLRPCLKRCGCLATIRAAASCLECHLEGFSFGYYLEQAPSGASIAIMLFSSGRNP